MTDHPIAAGASGISRRGFLAGCATAAAIAPGAAMATVSDDDDAPLFALLRRHEALEQEYCDAGEAEEVALSAMRPYSNAANDAEKKSNQILEAAKSRIYSDEQCMESLVREPLPPDIAEDDFASKARVLVDLVRDLAASDPEARAAAAEWREAKAKRDAFRAANVAPIEAASEAAWQAFDAAQRQIIVYPVRTAAGLRAKLEAIHEYNMDPHDGEKPNIYSAYEVPDLAAIVLADVERVLGG